MLGRRRFLGSVGLPLGTLAATPRLSWAGVGRALAAAGSLPADASDDPDRAARDEPFWFEVQSAFTVDRSLINLNNGGVSPAPAGVQEAMRRHLEYSHQAPAYTMWRILEPQKEGVRRRLAALFGCDPEEMALTRNASEGLQICQFGFDLARGDEVLTTNQDYPRMITTWQQRERREGIVLRRISLPVPAEDPAEVVRRFEVAITPRTRLILLCHVINLTGQILPVREVVEMARRRGIPVIVDGAHSFAQFPFTRDDLGCDYLATSLHKWLNAPHGTGFLYVRRERIPALWPLMAADTALDADIRKYEEIGTHPAANTLAIAEAVVFHEGVGVRRKAARLRLLRDECVRPLLDHPRVRLHTSLDPRFSCALACLGVEGMEPEALADLLWDRHRILVTPIRHDEFQGIRVTPGIYTTRSETARFVEAMQSILRNGIAT